MTNFCFRLGILWCAIFCTTQINAQHLTISIGGESGTSGTNWSISGNTLNVAASGSANIHPNVISNHLNSVGDLTVVLPWQISVIRQCSIDGTITYTGSATRTLTFLIANDIFMTSTNQSITATGSGALNVVLRAANSGGFSPDNGRISIRQNNTINTNGGHLWIGGGSVDVTWNGLTVGNHFARTWSDDVPGLWIENSTLNTNGGNVYLAGLSHNSSANSGENYGVHMVNSDISSVSGNIEINGELKGRYQIGNGTRIQSTTTTATSITTTTGSISIRGTGSDNSPNDNGYRFGAVITGSLSTAKTIISSTSGNIQIEGNAYFAATVDDKEGLGIGGSTEIISRSGNITIRGTNSLETSGQYCNSIRFDPRNESNSIRVGFDGTNSYTGNILIEGNSIYQRYLHSSTGSIAVQTTGTLTIQPTGTAFTYMRADNAGTLTYDNDWNFGTTLSSFTFGKSTNTTNLTFANVLSPAGPITIYGGNININENLNTSAGASSGNVLLKGTGDIILAASKSITTSGASVILWANSDNASSNGSIALRNASSIVTGSNTVAGGHVWIGGGSNGTTWNGLSVGNGYAVPGTSFTPSNNGSDIAAGIYLERNSITSFGGNIKIAGDGAASARGIVSYGNTININSGSGKIEMDGQVTSTAAGNRGGILFGLHDNEIASTVNLSSSSTSGDAITITGIGRGTADAIGLSGTVNITASGGGNIVMNGNALGTGRSIVAGNYYHGILNVFANSGNITLNGNTKAVQVATAVINGLTSGPSKINIGQGGSISSSSSNVVLTADNIALAAGGIAVNTSGTVTIEPSSNSFASALTYPVTDLSIANTITGLTLGKSTNTANITVSSAQSIAGPINIYGGTISVNENVSSSAGGNITLFGNSLTFASGKTLSSTGELLVAPQSASNTIGIAGASGTLQLPASYFSTNFTDGFSNITIGSDNQTGNISSDALTLQDPLTIKTSGNLTLGGSVTMENNNVTLSSSIASISGMPGNYLKTTGTGVVKRSLTNTNTFAFPVGNIAYNPVSITNNSGSSDDFTVRVLDEVYANGLTGAAISTTRIKRTWDIGKANANSGSGVDFVFNWNSGEESNTLYNPSLYHYESGAWVEKVPTSSSSSATSYTFNGYTGTFSPFYVGDQQNPLPVTLIDFTVACEENQPVFEWSTAAEINNHYFSVDQSKDQNQWQSVVQVTGAGNSNVTTIYRHVFNSFNPANGRYFRLRQVDYNGTEEVVSQKYLSGCDGMVNGLVVFPNPANEQVQVQQLDANTEVQLVNALGAVLQVLQSNSAGQITITLPDESGVYYIRGMQQGTIVVQKVMKV